MSHLSVERRGAVALLTLSNSQKRNALDPHLLDALCTALGELPTQGVRAAVLTGEGDAAFSSGYDISHLPHGTAPTWNPMALAVSAITDGDLPVVAALNGVAIGGGLELAATCDLRVAHPAVLFTMPPVRLGLVYPASGLRRFTSLIGASRTRELFLTAAPVDAHRALEWGLVDRVVAAGAVVSTALELAEAIARGAPLAVRGIRHTLERLTPPLSPEVEAELEALLRRAWESHDAHEARAAFREKRPPKFTGQ
jgi:enoyl-CoA hydratase/carnithine racemase